jgi:hypothetical protein
MKSFKEYLKEAGAVSSLTPGQLLQIKPYLKTDADGSQYYDYPDTDPKEVGAIMGTKITSPAALAQTKSPQGQAEVIKHLLAHTDSANAVNPVTTTTTAMSDADAAAAVPQNEDAELIRWQKIAGLVKEADTSKIKVPPTPALPQIPQGIEGEQTREGGVSYELDGGSKLTVNQDGTKSYSGAWGSFTYDKAGKAIKYSSPSIGGFNGEVDLVSGDQTSNFQHGDLSVAQTQAPGGYVKQSDAQYNLGTATVGQKVAGPDIAAGQLAGTTTNTVTNNQTGQAKQQVQGVAFGGASGKNVGNNTVGATKDELTQHAANSTADINSEDIHRLRKLSGIDDKEIDEAPEPPKPATGAAPMPPAGGSTQPAPKPANPPPMPPAGQDMDLTKVDNDTLFGKYQQIQSTLNFMQPQAGDKQTYTQSDPASQAMVKGMQDQLIQADKELKKRGYTDQQLKPAAAPVKKLDQSDGSFKEDLEAMLKIARLR